MLKLAFGGRVVWVHDRGHIAWADCPEDASFEELQKAVVYDITGIYDDYELLWPIEYLGDVVTDYKHNGKVVHVNDKFKAWCDSLGVSECFAITFVWETIPVENLIEEYHCGHNCIHTAMVRWSKHASEYENIFKHVNDKDSLRTAQLPLHSGESAILQYLADKSLQ